MSLAKSLTYSEIWSSRLDVNHDTWGYWIYSNRQQDRDKNKTRECQLLNIIKSKHCKIWDNNNKTNQECCKNSKGQILPMQMHHSDNVMHMLRPEVEHLKSKCVLWPWGRWVYILPPLQQLNSVCLFLIRAVGEFSAQNENSRENSHHHRTAKFSISRNYAWPDVSIWVASMGFFFFIFFLENSLLYHFWLNEEELVLFWLPLFFLSIENTLKGKKNNKMSSYPRGPLWNYSISLPPKFFPVYRECYQLIVLFNTVILHPHMI